MGFTDRAKTVARAIVKIFETGKPLGNYSAVAVLTDGAGISYGINQFTHKSGSLAAVIRRYLKLKGSIPSVMADALNDLSAGRNIVAWSGSKALKSALAEAGKDPLMQQAQREIGFENYLQPALVACEGSDFQYPLSLAVIYDSINQGGYATVRDKVKFQAPGNGSIKPEEFEREWITEYCRKRKAWLKASKKSIVRATTYRPDFFLGEIAKGNWDLKLPLTVHGHKLTESILFPKSSAAASTAEGKADHPAGAAAGSTPQSGPANTIEPPPTVTEQTTVETPKGTSVATTTTESGTVEMTAPPKDGATAASTKMVIAGVTVPPIIAGVLKAISDAVSQGYVSAGEIGTFLMSFLRDNIKWVLVLFGLVIILLIVKKILKQISFWLQMLTHAIPGWNSIEVQPVPVEPKKGWLRRAWEWVW